MRPPRGVLLITEFGPMRLRRGAVVRGWRVLAVAWCEHQLAGVQSTLKLEFTRMVGPSKLGNLWP